VRCPICGSVEVHHSQSREVLDWVMMMVNKMAFRCYICNRRFYAREPKAPAAMEG
jgi:transcription elongation factor Elf1